MSDKLHVVCSHCDSINRLPVDKLEEGGQCGACHKVLFTAQVMDLTEPRFYKHITKNDIPLLVDFWAPWCAPCKIMGPTYAKAANDLEPYIRLAKVNTENEQALASKYNIRSIPSMVLFKQGVEAARTSGVMEKNDLLDWVQQHL